MVIGAVLREGLGSLLGIGSFISSLDIGSLLYGFIISDPLGYYFVLLRIFLLLLILGLASWEDLLTREVADTISFSAIGFGLSLGLAESIVAFSWVPLLASLCGFLLMLLVGFLFYFSKQWGGGDAKLVLGVGAIIGFWKGHYLLLWFLLLTMISGGLYGILYSLWLIFVNKRSFTRYFSKIIHEGFVLRLRKIIVYSLLLLFFLLLSSDFFSSLFLSGGLATISYYWPVVVKALLFLGVFLYFSFYLFLIVTAVEKGVLRKRVSVGSLTLGDWVDEKVVVGGELLYDPDKELGVSDEHILLFKKKGVKKVVVKEGIPFVPAFFLGFLLLLIILLL